MSRCGLVQSLTRGLDILDVVALRGEARLQDIVAATGLKKPTAHNLIRTLAAAGHLHQAHAGGCYMIGEAPLRLAMARRRQRLLVSGEAAMRETHRELSDATLTLALHVEGTIAVVLRLAGQESGAVERPLGLVMHPYSTASSLLFQAMWSEEDRDAFRLRHPFPEYGGPLWGSEAQLDAFLAQARERECAVLTGLPNRLPLAAPIRDRGGHMLAAFGVSTSGSECVDPARVARAVTAARAAAAHIAESMAAQHG
jgi:DNA-binding IclR family transcriptional regulator